MRKENKLPYVTPMFIAHGEHNAEVMAWKQQYSWTEQYLGKKVRAQFSRNGKRVRLALTNSSGAAEDGYQRIISAEEWHSRPAAGRDKAEARWAMALLGVSTTAPE